MNNRVQTCLVFKQLRYNPQSLARLINDPDFLKHFYFYANWSFYLREILYFFKANQFIRENIEFEFIIQSSNNPDSSICMTMSLNLAESILDEGCYFSILRNVIRRLILWRFLPEGNMTDVNILRSNWNTGPINNLLQIVAGVFRDN